MFVFIKLLPSLKNLSGKQNLLNSSFHYFQIKNPHSQKPSLKFGTIPSSYSEVTLKKYFPEVFSYMKPFNIYNTTERAMKAIKEG